MKRKRLWVRRAAQGDVNDSDIGAPLNAIAPTFGRHIKPIETEITRLFPSATRSLIFSVSNAIWRRAFTKEPVQEANCASNAMMGSVQVLASTAPNLTWARGLFPAPSQHHDRRSGTRSFIRSVIVNLSYLEIERCAFLYSHSSASSQLH